MTILTIFLDIDGVLNTEYTAKDNEYLICPKLVQIFNDFLSDKLLVDIVISSSWRYDMEELKFQLDQAGARFWHRVVGKTPSYKILTRRGEQIQRWIDDNQHDGKYIVIDDEIHDIVTDIPEEFVFKTDPKVGVTKEMFEKFGEIDRIYERSKWEHGKDAYLGDGSHVPDSLAFYFF